ncbi:hypothetical protein ET475_14600 [Microbacterium protaetiae]|uniref:NADH:ubiquinone oxidoreductase n=1 Tax=Microbacterium protaetiae TaxID=2509458 RepID=A0A4P6EFD7_9MICO|nr:hypothetical protein [Microbacterium protaetiae]QAY61090.1 hypothetical protein ET475_14600 [Microbacterium protaetiae]
MRKYLFGTGLIGAITSGLSMLKALRTGEPFTWRAALAWLSWGITAALAIGAVVDIRRASTGHLAPEDSPVAGHEKKYLKQRLER